MSVCLRQNQPVKSNILFKKEINRYLMFYKVCKMDKITVGTLLQLKSLAAPNSDEQQHLVEALIGMERVAEHINEMQRIHEEYGAIFDHLFRQHQKTSKQVGHGGLV